MKNVSKRFLLTVLLVFFWSEVFSQDPCPCGDGGDGSGVPPPPGGCPPCPVIIDESIMILLIIALVLGVYIIYKHRIKTKTPI
jgi:hypothetical protein